MARPKCCICRGEKLSTRPGAVNVLCQKHREMTHDLEPVLREYTSAERKEMPVWSILSQYFPDAFAALARHSKKANDKHNPGEPLHWARNKSSDHLECAVRHLMTPDEIDKDTGEIELVGALWRCAAALQLREEARLKKAGIKPLSGVV